MDLSMRRRQSGGFIYYTCDRIAEPHCFTTKFGGVSAGDCAGLNFRRGHGDPEENILQNYHILCDALDIPADRLTITHQVHEDRVIAVTEEAVGTGIAKPLDWEVDALITNLPDTPLVGFYADCVVTLLYDPVSRSCGVCHAGWRGTAREILGKTVDKMADLYGADRASIVAVIGPSIRSCCFETDADVPTAMEQMMGARVEPFVQPREQKFYVDLQGINRITLLSVGVQSENIIDSGICTKCEHEEFWSHRATNGRRGVQAGVICLRKESNI
ncbi:MAG: peptidoglycan editing factor PgeF [Butyricicoccus sp.]|nr:peptidoglycan editing factor PgeF [Butyricicoccus sp.]